MSTGQSTNGSTETNLRKRRPSSDECESRKRLRIDGSESKTSQQRACNLQECNGHNKLLDPATDIALDYLLALDPTHKLFERTVKQVLEWAGDGGHVESAIDDPLSHVIAHLDEKAGPNGQADSEVVARLVDGWASKVLKGLTETINSHIGIEGYRKFAVEQDSDDYKIELKITPVHKIEDSGDEEEGPEGGDRAEEANERRNATWRVRDHQHVDESVEGSEEEDEDDEDADNDGTDAEEDSAPAAEEDYEAASDRDNIRSRSSRSALLTPEDETPVGQQSFDEPRPPSLQPRRAQIHRFPEHKIPEKCLLFKMPEFSKGERKLRYWMAHPEREIDRCVRTSLNIALANAGVVSISPDSYLRKTWVIAFSSSENANRARHHQIDFHGKQAQLQPCGRRVCTLFVCKKVPPTMARDEVKRRIFKLFPNESMQLKWAPGDGTSKDQRGTLMVIFRHPRDIRHFSLPLPTETGDNWYATFHAWVDRGGCSVCSGKSHAMETCRRFRGIL